jgi:RecA-family ATPase
MTRLVSLSDLSTLEVAHHDWIIPGYFPQPGVLMILGEPRAGKSFLALQLALSIAQGTPFLPGTTTAKKRVLYFYFDKTGVFAFQDRLKSLAANGVDLTGPIFLIHPDDKLPAANVMDMAHYNYFKSIIHDAQPDVVFFDVLREFHSSDENESTEMKLVGDQLATLCQGLAMVIVHHTRKPDALKTGIPRNVEVARGSNYIAGKADATWLIHHDHIGQKYYLQTEANFAGDKRYQLTRYPDGRWMIV